MNRMIRSRLSSIAVVLIVSTALVGCCELCGVTCYVLTLGIVWPLLYICACALCPVCVADISPCYSDISAAMSQLCEEYPDQCAATFEYYQNASIPFCEEYPETCQQAFDAWVESLEEEEIE